MIRHSHLSKRRVLGATGSRLLLALAALGAGCRGAEDPVCSAGEPARVEPAAWAAELEATSSGAAYAARLAELRLKPLPEPGGAELPTTAEMALTSVEIVPLGRADGEPPDRLVAARFADGAGSESLRAQLLRPLPGREGAWCALGDELSHDKAPNEEPCLEPHEGPARTLGRETLVAPGREALVARDAGGWCGPGTRRGDRRATSFWGVEEGRLVRYLEVVTFEAWYESPAPPAEVRRAEIELGDGWPRTVTVTETVWCAPPAETPDGEPPDAGGGAPGEGAAGDPGCEPTTFTTHHHYRDGRYVASEERTP